jgi:hypothetical protein
LVQVEQELQAHLTLEVVEQILRLAPLHLLAAVAVVVLIVLLMTEKLAVQAEVLA